MKAFLKRILYFSILPTILFIWVETSVRHNSFEIKANYIAQHKDEIELMVLGSSHNNRAINPEFLDMPAALLAHAGSPANINILLFEKFFPQFPKLKYVIFETSYPSLEYSRGNDWEKNHLFLHYYGINNYGKKYPPLKERFLFTANPKNYMWKFLFKNKKDKIESYNQFGFMKGAKNEYQQLDFDLDRIKKKHLHSRKKHQLEDTLSYKKNIVMLDKAINQCLEKNIKVILLAPPTFFLYNKDRNKNVLARRDHYLEKYQNVENVFVWNYEEKYQNQVEYFANENHLNPYGAEVFTKELNARIKQMETQ